jgi:protein neuralized
MPASVPPPIPTRRSVGNVSDTLPTTLPLSVTMHVAETDNRASSKAAALDAPSNECAVCLENPPDCVLYTCGHMCMCYVCAVDVVRNRGALCPICRQVIRDVIKIFRS